MTTDPTTAIHRPTEAEAYINGVRMGAMTVSATGEAEAEGYALALADTDLFPGAYWDGVRDGIRAALG